MFNKIDIVTRITSLLSEKKIPAIKFAEDMGGKERGYSKDTVYTWKTNRSTSYMDDLERIANYLDVSTDFLLTGEENNQKAKSEPSSIAGLARDIEHILLERGIIKEDMPMSQDVKNALLDYLSLSVEAFKKAREK